MPSQLVADYASLDTFLDAVELELAHGGLLVRGAQTDAARGACVVEVRLLGRTLATVEGQIEAVRRSGVAVTFEDVPFELVAMADRLRAGESLEAVVPAEDAAAEEKPAARGTMAERLAALTVPQKIKEALAGEREARLHLLRDPNKVLHAFVLKNPRVQLDEVLWAAKMPTLAPDALQFIGEHKEWGQNLQIACALVRNPRTPTPLALRLLPRLPPGEIRAIAKGGARDQIVHAARKMLAG